jgi:hypothetical protein
MAGRPDPRIIWGELIGEVAFILLGVVVVRLGWTTFGETMVAIGIFGLATWPFRFWRARRRPDSEAPRSD